MLILKELSQAITVLEVALNIRVRGGITDRLATDTVPHQFKSRFPRDLDIHECLFSEHPRSK
jgi:hypothetical protein